MQGKYGVNNQSRSGRGADDNAGRPAVHGGRGQEEKMSSSSKGLTQENDRTWTQRTSEERVIELSQGIRTERAKIEREIECMNDRLSARGVRSKRNKTVQKPKRE